MEPIKIIYDYKQELRSLAYPTAADDRQLSNTAKDDQLNKIDALLTKALFDAKDLPELFFLTDRVSRLAPDSARIEAINAQIKRISGEPCGPEETLIRDIACLALKVDKLKPGESMFTRLSQALDEKVLKGTNNFSVGLPSQLLNICRDYFEQKSKGPTLSWSDFVRCVRVVPLKETTTVAELVQSKMDRELVEHGVDIEKLKANKRGFPFQSKVLKHLLSISTTTVDFGVEKDKITDAMRLEAVIIKIKKDAELNKRNRLSLFIDGKDLLMTSLTLSVLLGDIDTIRMLLEKGYPVNETDAQRFTPAHFAALMPDYDMLLLLRAHGADFSLQNKYQGTVYDLLKARGFALKDKTRQVEFFKGEELSLSQVEERLKRKYYDENVFSLDSLLCLWYQSINPPEHGLPFDIAMYESYVRAKEQNPSSMPSIHIRKIAKGEDGRPSPLDGQWEVAAARNFEANDLIIEYTGDVVAQPVYTETSYKMSLPNYGPLYIEAEYGGSGAEIINHGPPNCTSMLINYKGTPRLVLFAARKIQAGEPLLYNYKKSYFDFYQFHELSPTAIDAFMKQTNALENIDPFLVDIIHNRKSVIKFTDDKMIFDTKPFEPGKLDDLWSQKIYIQRMLGYIIEFPDHLLELVHAGKVKISTVATLLTFIQERRMWSIFELEPIDCQKLLQKLRGRS